MLEMKRLRTLVFLLSFGLLSLAVHAQERWVVTAAYAAEIVVALGGSSRIVALGGNTDHLEGLAHLPRLQGFRQTSAEPFLSFNPTRVLMTNEWVQPQTVEQLRAAGVKVDILDGEHNPAGVERRIRRIAELLGQAEAGEQLIRRFHQDMAAAAREVSAIKQRPRAIFILAGGKRPLLVGGRGTQAAALIELAGGINVAQDIEGFKPMSQESMIQAAPEVILTNKDGLTPTADGLPIALKSPGAAATPAARQGRVINIPDRYLGGMGIYTPQGIRLLMREMHRPKP